MGKHSTAALISRLETVSKRLALLVVLTSSVMVLGWIFDWPMVSRIPASEPSTKFLTATFLGLSGFLLWVFQRTTTKPPNWLTTAGGVVVTVGGMVCLLDSFFGWMPIAGGRESILGRIFLSMSPATAMIVLCFGISLTSLSLRKPSIAHVFAIVSGTLAFVGLVGVTYGVDVVASGPLFSTMSVPTALCSLGLGAAILLACPNAGWMKPFTAEAGGDVMRRLLPFIIGLPVLFGWLRLKGEEAGLFSSELGTAITVAGTTLAFAFLVLQVGRALNRSEEEKRLALERLRRNEEKLSKHAKHLEERVAERTKALQDTVNSLEGFVYSLAHDLRAPLRAMQGFIVALEEEYGSQLDSTGREYCRRVRHASNRMDELIVDLLEFGRLAHIDVPRDRVDLNNEIESVLNMLREPIEQTHARIEVEKPLPKVCGERTIVDQVLVNLVENALKFVPQSVQPIIRIYSEPRKDRVRLWVEDNGIGVAPEHTQGIFQIFHRLHSDGTYPGTGIGLAIVQKGVEKMGGRVGVESQIGKGSKFWIELPDESRCAA